MLTLKNIKKDYFVAGQPVHALRGVSVSFRKSEFVSILGPSGCGKTTLLNIIGGLDRYTSGELSIAGIPTQRFSDADWDGYRNHRVGFVFQTYNLIPHQTVASNVELALTLSGVPRSLRRRKALDALAAVGLEGQGNKKPNQLSGGQMQRVAIARALVNDPEILLADEPTGALDTETSVQVMDILREVASKRLVIMVTHNSELAERYSTRIIRLRDGLITGDTKPYEGEEIQPEQPKHKKKHPGMSFGTAFSLSLNNLMTKKTRTILTSFAGSIGIIGIALILSMSNGIQTFINRVQTDTLSSYPLSISHESFNMASMLAVTEEEGEIDLPGRLSNETVYSSDTIKNMVDAMTGGVVYNDLKSLKEFIESDECFYTEANGSKTPISELVTGIKYDYDIPFLIYSSDTSNGATRLDPGIVFKKLYGDLYDTIMSSQAIGVDTFSSMMNVWEEMIDNEELLKQQYNKLTGEWPTEANEVMLFINGRKELGDMLQYALGLRDVNEIDEILDKIYAGEDVEIPQLTFSYDDLLNMTFKLVLPTDKYEYDETEKIWKDVSGDAEKLKSIVNNGLTVKISGIAMPNPDAVAVSATAYVGYTKALTEYIVNGINNSEIVKQQKATPAVNVFSGLEFPPSEITAEYIKEMISEMPEEEREKIEPYLSMISDEQLVAMFKDRYKSGSTYDGNLNLLGVSDFSTPSKIMIYPLSFETKDKICSIIDSRNEALIASGEEGKSVSYTDSVGLLMSSITVILDAISIVLIAFVSVSLVVSSIMIGVITYISVLERTKEIGILRSVGASKRDISRVFNAETLLVGFAAGAIGIGLTLLLTVPINAIIYYFAGINVTAILPAAGGVILIIISMLLTFIAGLIPSSIAAKRDPVVALRSE